MSDVQQRLDDWRDVERRLEAATDPGEIERLEQEVDRLREAYREAAAVAFSELASEVIGPLEEVPMMMHAVVDPAGSTSAEFGR